MSKKNFTKSFKHSRNSLAKIYQNTTNITVLITVLFIFILAGGIVAYIKLSNKNTSQERSWSAPLNEKAPVIDKKTDVTSNKTKRSYGNSASNYSPTATEQTVEHGAVMLTANGTELSWTYTGTAPKGFAVLISTNSDLRYPSHVRAELPDTKFDIMVELVESGVYFVKVCKLVEVNESCTDFSNGVQVTFP